MGYHYQKTIAEFDLETMNQEVEAFCVHNAVPGNKLFSIQLIIISRQKRTTCEKYFRLMPSAFCLARE
jgi:hypothetical protein